MSAFSLSRDLLTFYAVFREEAISAEEKLVLFRDMRADVPAEMSLPPSSRGARNVLFNKLAEAIDDHTRRAEAKAQEPEPQAPKAHAPKARHTSRK